MTDYPLASFSFVKVSDKSTNTKLADAVFTLYRLDDEDGEATEVKLGTFTSGSDGKVNVTDLDEGEYILRETEAPEGYSACEDITITVTADAAGKLSVTAKLGTVALKNGGNVADPHLVQKTQNLEPGGIFNKQLKAMQTASGKSSIKVVFDTYANHADEFEWYPANDSRVLNNTAYSSMTSANVNSACFKAASERRNSATSKTRNNNDKYASSVDGDLENDAIRMYYKDGTAYVLVNDTESDYKPLQVIYANRNSKNTFDCYSNGVNITSVDWGVYRTEFIVDAECMFYHAKFLTNELDNGLISNWNMTSLRRATSMFDGCTNVKHVNLNNWSKTSHQLDDVASMFANCTEILDIDVSKWDTTVLRNIYLMCHNCHKLESIQMHWNVDDNSHEYITYENGDYYTGDKAPRKISFITLQVTQPTTNSTNARRAGLTFYNCYALKEIDISGWNMKNTTYIGGTSTNPADSSYGRDTETGYYCMFDNCYALERVIANDITVAGTKQFNFMFANCKSLKEIVGIESWNWGTNALQMEGMFQGCESLTSLDLTTMNTAKVRSTLDMFANCKNLEKIVVGPNWKNTNMSTRDAGMFRGCVALVGQMGTAYDAANVTSKYAIVDQGTTQPGYLTLSGSNVDELLETAEILSIAITKGDDGMPESLNGAVPTAPDGYKIKSITLYKAVFNADGTDIVAGSEKVAASYTDVPSGDDGAASFTYTVKSEDAAYDAWRMVVIYTPAN